ncbi:hypothetical protein BN381_130005 [Candidatus Microthrix parvicella RN1]|uniref:Uncharacterized protein n=1 Tax=Candidatus Neomicrothrix parvicella RN1 TaxID=1229780 RepID=R4Z1G7_9ACTN|nr:hypothetical protein BN381_130005 [Candidatus Microthrix parvicella RN1]
MVRSTASAVQPVNLGDSGVEIGAPSLPEDGGSSLEEGGSSVDDGGVSDVGDGESHAG